MTNQQILEKVIQKAIDGGWQHERIPTPQTSVEYWSKQDYRTFVYRHDFAKALWGERETKSEYGNQNYSFGGGAYKKAAKGDFYSVVNEGWQYHLQRMVIAEDPIKYLGENI